MSSNVAWLNDNLCIEYGRWEREEGKKREVRCTVCWQYTRTVYSMWHYVRIVRIIEEGGLSAPQQELSVYHVWGGCM